MSDEISYPSLVIDTVLPKRDRLAVEHFIQAWFQRDDALRAETAQLRADLDKARAERDALQVQLTGDHGFNPEKCPTYYDGCNCGGALQRQAEEVGAERDTLQAENERLNQTVATLRDHLADPPPDVQEAVLDKLGLREVCSENERLKEEIAKSIGEDAIRREQHDDVIATLKADNERLMQRVFQLETVVKGNEVIADMALEERDQLKQRVGELEAQQQINQP